MKVDDITQEGDKLYIHAEHYNSLDITNLQDGTFLIQVFGEGMEFHLSRPQVKELIEFLNA